MEVTSTTLIGQTQTRLRLAHGAGGLGAILKVAKPGRQKHMAGVAHLYYWPASFGYYSAFPILSSL